MEHKHLFVQFSQLSVPIQLYFCILLKQLVFRVLQVTYTHIRGAKGRVVELQWRVMNLDHSAIHYILPLALVHILT